MLFLWLLLVLLAVGANKPPRAKKHGRLKVKMAHSTIKGERYGADLPGFSYDYSEYFVGAVIERSGDSDALHLAMFLLGHRTIANDLPIESISTDEEVLYQWSNAVKHFTPNRTLGAHSGYQCVLMNNDPKYKQPYSAPASWITLPRHMQKAQISGNVEILRCKLKGSATAYELLSHTGAHLLVDIVRRASARSAGNGTASLGRDDVSSGVAALDQSATIFSFSVPWHSRYSGYGLDFKSPNASNLNPWQPATAAASSSSNSSFNRPRVFVCSALVRPLRQPAPSVALPMLLEFIEHHLMIGVEHVVLGMLLDWRSVHMNRYLALLQPFVSRGQVSLSSLALPGFDDVAGFNGLHINEVFAEWLFDNQCLYYSKGIADFVLMMHPHNFLYPSLQNRVASVHDLLSAPDGFPLYYDRPRFFHISTAAKGGNATASTRGRGRGRAQPRSLATHCFARVRNLVVEDVSKSAARAELAAAWTSASGPHALGLPKFESDIGVFPSQSVFVAASQYSGSCQQPGNRYLQLAGRAAPTNHSTLAQSCVVSYIDYFVNKFRLLSRLDPASPLNAHLTDALPAIGNIISIYHAFLLERLRQRGLSSATEVVLKGRAIDNEFARFRSRQTVAGAETAQEVAVGVAALVEPFWKSCNTDNLAEVLKRVLG